MGGSKSLFSLFCAVASVCIGVQAQEIKTVKVFPVREFFADISEQSTLDPRFLDAVKTRDLVALSDKVFNVLNTAFTGKTGALDNNTAKNTFAVSFHVTRATSYQVDKGNGNSDVVATVTASLYFTNVLSGEILTTFAETAIGRAVISNNDDLRLTKVRLFSTQIDTLLNSLVTSAAQHFSPIVVSARAVDKVDNLLILDMGYAKGIQAGDMLNGADHELIQVVYASDNYSVASPVIPQSLNRGGTFQKVMAYPADGRAKPPAMVLSESLPSKYSADYVNQIFSDAVGGKAPFSMVQVNQSFGKLMGSVARSSQLGRNDLAKKRPPELFIRLRIAEPIIYEAGTNLEYKRIRHYETLAFADVIDTNGRVNFSAIGKDVINDDITNNIGPGFEERREVSIKNALINLAEKLAKMGDMRIEQTPVLSSSASEAYISGAGKVFPRRQNGVLLHKFKAQFGKETKQIWVPVAEAFVDATEEDNKVRLGLGAPLMNSEVKLLPTDVFEVERLGPTPRSAQTMEVCGPAENLGSILTPSLIDLTNYALGSQMPGMLYARSIKSLADPLINSGTNFSSEVKWDFPQVNFCVQPVERVNAGDDVCTNGQCERQIVARYTLRVKAANDVLSRTTFETQFKSTGYYRQSTPTHHIEKLLHADLIDETQSLMEKIVAKLSFTKP